MACQLLLAVCAGPSHVVRAYRICLCCNSGAVGDKKHIFVCTALLLGGMQTSSQL